MTKRIIYPSNDGGVAIVVPSPEALETMTIEEIAAKDILPIVRYEGTGVFEKDEDTGEMHETQREIEEPRPYKIVDITDFPLELDAQGNPVLDEFGVVKHDRTFRNAWEYTA